MKILLIAVGKTAGKPLTAMIEDYVARLKHYTPFEMEIVPELKNTRGLTPMVQKQREGDLVVKRLRAGVGVVLLDEKGHELR